MFDFKTDYSSQETKVSAPPPVPDRQVHTNWQNVKDFFRNNRLFSKIGEFFSKFHRKSISTKTEIANPASPPIAKVTGVAAITFQTPEGVHYAGEVNEQKMPHGQGTFVEKDGGTYSGGFLNGKKHGKGVREFANGNRLVGQFENGKFVSGFAIMNVDGSETKYILKEGKWTKADPFPKAPDSDPNAL